MITNRGAEKFGLFCIIITLFPFGSVQQVPIERKFLGCFVDDYDRNLPDYNCVLGQTPECTSCAGNGRGCQSDNMTVDICLALCAGDGHVFAGVQSGNECYCGDEGAPYQKWGGGEMTCGKLCAGNNNQTCGGNYYSSVYDTRKSCIILGLDEFITTSEATVFDDVPVVFDTGGRITFTCQAEYVLSREGSSQCQADGTWVPGIPSCNPNGIISSSVTCQPIQAPVNGAIKSSQRIFKEGQIATFECSVGFVLQGFMFIECNADGTWSSTPPTCVERLCNIPPVIPNANLALNEKGRKVGGNVIYWCQEEFEAPGGPNFHRMCTKTWEWEGVLPNCVAVDNRNNDGKLTVNIPENSPVGASENELPSAFWVIVIIAVVIVTLIVVSCIAIQSCDREERRRQQKASVLLVPDGVHVDSKFQNQNQNQIQPPPPPPLTAM